MLAGEKVVAVSLPGTLYLVPMSDGAAKPLPKSLRYGGRQRGMSLHQSPQRYGPSAGGSGSAQNDSGLDAFSPEAIRVKSVVPVQVISSNFRLVFKPFSGSAAASLEHQPEAQDSVHADRHHTQIPYMLIDRIETDIRQKDNVFSLVLITKWTWVFRIQSLSQDPICSLASSIESNFPKQLNQFFAFAHFAELTQRYERLTKKTSSLVADGSSNSGVASTPYAHEEVPLSLRDGNGGYDTAWGAFSLERELHRQTVLNGTPFASNCAKLPGAGDPALSGFGCGKNLRPWFHVVPLARQDIFHSYPTSVVVPRKVNADLLERCAEYRQNGRVPVISWIHGCNGATLSRASQPKSGSRRSGKDDQTVCSYLNQSYHATNTICAPPATLKAPHGHHHHDPGLQGLQDATGGVSHDSRVGGGIAPPAALVPPPSLMHPTSPTAASAKSSLPTPSRQPPPLYSESPPSSACSDDNDYQQSMSPSDEDDTQPVDATATETSCPSSAAAVLANKPEYRSLVFIDCRSRTAAAANLATGGGFEMVRNYDRAAIEFMGLDNIHAVRDSFDKLQKLCVSLQQPQNDCPSNRTSSGSFFSRLDATGWVLLQQRLLWASWKTATLLHSGASVLVHCTDGWDRTSQVVSLAKMQLDAHYRTIEGFCELIMAEWCDMGHKFADRCGMERPGEDGEFICVGSDGEEESGDDEPGSSSSASKAAESSAAGSGGIAALFASPQKTNKSHSPRSQYAPIFLQFIDAVYQLWHMYPQQFEFTPAFLTMLLVSVYSCRFGTFLHNCFRMRMRKNGLVSKTASLWGYIEDALEQERAAPSSIPADERWINPFYRPKMSRIASATDAAVVPSASTEEHIARLFYSQRIVPSFQAFRFRFWTSLYCKLQWEGTGCPPEGDVFSPLYDAVLWASSQRAAEQVARRQMSSDPSDEGWMYCDAVAGEEAAPRQNSGSMGCRRMFSHRIPLSHLSTEWQVLRRAATEVAQDGDLQQSNGSTPIGPDSVPPRSHAVLGEPNFKPRSTMNACELCSAEFSLFFRRHTCRRCCRAACNNCCNHFMSMPRNTIQLQDERDAEHPVRLCGPCYNMMKQVVLAAPPPLARAV